MWHRYISLAVALLVLLAPRLAVHAQSPAEVDVRAAPANFPDIVADFRVKGASGQYITGLTSSDVRIIEDGTAITNVTWASQRADKSKPTLTVSLSDGKTEELSTTGATIGVVFDATTLLNGAQGAGTGADYLAEGREAIKQFLFQTGPQAPNNSEAIGLFIPIASSDQKVQQDVPDANAEGFTQNRNGLINTMLTTEVRTGKTNLYDAIREAVEDTASVARQRGSAAVVLVVSDGGDTVSAGSFDALIQQAIANKVTVIAFGVGTDRSLNEQRGGFRLNQLASTTQGVYLPHPDAAAAKNAFDTVVAATPAEIYTISYKTALIQDAKPHSFMIQVRLSDGSGQASSQQIPIVFPPASSQPKSGLNQALLHYLRIAVPAALIVSLLIALLMGALRWSRSRSVGKLSARR
jgi:hypothetical protein